jgi:hypothetical protein
LGGVFDVYIQSRVVLVYSVAGNSTACTVGSIDPYVIPMPIPPGTIILYDRITTFCVLIVLILYGNIVIVLYLALYVRVELDGIRRTWSCIVNYLC